MVFKVLRVIASVTWQCFGCGSVTVAEDKGQAAFACRDCGCYCRKVTQVADEVVL